MAAPAILMAQATLSTISTFAAVEARNKQARFEADIARQQADYQRRLAESESATLRRRADRMLGQQAAKFAASGMDLSSGSALLAQQSLASEAEIEALQRRNAGYIQAASYENSARSGLSRARAAAQQDHLSMGTRLLGDFDKLSRIWP